MDRELKERWVMDLTANADRQGRGYMLSIEPDGPRWCALGRLGVVCGLSDEQLRSGQYSALEKATGITIADRSKVVLHNDGRGEYPPQDFHEIARWIKDGGLDGQPL